VNLLAAKGGGRKRATGDTNEMVQARRRFLDAGHYADAAEIIAEGVARYLAGRARGGAVDGAVDDPTGDENASEDDDDDVPNARRGERSSTPGTTDTKKQKKSLPRAERLAANKRRDARVKADRRLASAKREALERQDALNATLPLVVDFGCGEGYWLGVVAERVSAFNENEKKVSARFAGIDASPAAAKAAARRLSSRYGAEIAVGDAQRELDFADGVGGCRAERVRAPERERAGAGGQKERNGHRGVPGGCAPKRAESALRHSRASRDARHRRRYGQTRESFGNVSSR
jgi:hypothetical protein